MKPDVVFMVWSLVVSVQFETILLTSFGAIKLGLVWLIQMRYISHSLSCWDLCFSKGSCWPGKHCRLRSFGYYFNRNVARSHDPVWSRSYIWINKFDFLALQLCMLLEFNRNNYSAPCALEGNHPHLSQFHKQAGFHNCRCRLLRLLYAPPQKQKHRLDYEREIFFLLQLTARHTKIIKSYKRMGVGGQG